MLLPYRELDRTHPYSASLDAVGLPHDLAQAGEHASLDGYDGLLLMGGSDVNPELYGEQPQPETDAPDTDRDRLEYHLISEAMGRDMPILAICRGLQILNAWHGGSLVQHLDPSLGHQVRSTDKGEPVHAVDIEPGSLLERIAGQSTWQVNSRHHQAVRRPGAGLRINARDPRDGTIEGLERPDRRFVLAVQWHPEDQLSRCPEQMALFRSFAEAVAGKALAVTR